MFFLFNCKMDKNDKLYLFIYFWNILYNIKRFIIVIHNGSVHVDKTTKQFIEKQSEK